MTKKYFVKYLIHDRASGNSSQEKGRFFNTDDIEQELARFELFLDNEIEVIDIIYLGFNKD